MDYCEIHGPQRRNPADLGDPLTTGLLDSVPHRAASSLSFSDEDSLIHVSHSVSQMSLLRFLWNFVILVTANSII